MDYAVGSISDLITGSKTSNKRKVVKKQFAPSKNGNVNIGQDDLINKEGKKRMKKKHVKKISQDSFTETKGQKRKLENEDRGPPVKQRKNSSNALKRIKAKDKIENTAEEAIGKIQKLENEQSSGPVKQSKNSANALKRIKSKEKTEMNVEDPELLSRTIFVGNLPITSGTKEFKKLFKKYGKVEAIRVRGVPVADLKTPKKVAFIKKEFHPERKGIYAFVRFEQREDAIKATEANGMLYKDHHLRTHLCDGSNKPDESKAIFIGNLSFFAEEDDLWKLFELCGPITSVRIVRDGRTGIGKGFGYVNFENADSVSLALEMGNIKLKDRELRISICNINSAKSKKTKKIKKVRRSTKSKTPKNSTEGDKKEYSKTDGNPLDTSFHGVKFGDKKKKSKLDKGLLLKKRMVKKLAPKIK